MHADTRDHLIALLRHPTPAVREQLDSLKASATKDHDRPDFVWHFLLQSFATMGNSRGWQGLIGTLTDDRHTLTKVLAAAQHQCPFHYTASYQESQSWIAKKSVPLSTPRLRA